MTTLAQAILEVIKNTSGCDLVAHSMLVTTHERRKRMKLTAVEELVIRRKRKYKSYWRDASDWYWLWKLLWEMLELITALLRIYEDTPQHELEQIASICMNWIERRRR